MCYSFFRKQPGGKLWQIIIVNIVVQSGIQFLSLQSIHVGTVLQKNTFFMKEAKKQSMCANTVEASGQIFCLLLQILVGIVLQKDIVRHYS
jgi:hypothetical protein